MPAQITNNRSLRRQLSQAGRKLFVQAHGDDPTAAEEGFVLFHRVFRCCEATARLELVPPLPAVAALLEDGLQLVVVGNAYRVRCLVPTQPAAQLAGDGGSTEKTEISVLVKGWVHSTWVTREDGCSEQFNAFLARQPGPYAQLLIQLQQIMHMLDLGEAAQLAPAAVPAPVPCPAAYAAAAADEPPEFGPALSSGWSSMDRGSLAETEHVTQDKHSQRTFTFVVNGQGELTKLKQTVPEAGVLITLHLTNVSSVSRGLDLEPPPGIRSDLALAMENIEAQLAHANPALTRRLTGVFMEVDRDGDGLVSEADVVAALVRAGQTQSQAQHISSQMSAELAALSADPAEEFTEVDFLTFWLAMAGMSEFSLEQTVLGLERIFLGEEGAVLHPGPSVGP